MPKDAFKLPEKPEDLPLEKRKQLAREMFAKTRLNDAEIAKALMLNPRAVPPMRKHFLGELQPPKPKPSKNAASKGKQGQEAAKGQGEEGRSQAGTETPGTATSEERKEIHVASDLKDINSRVDGIETTLTSLGRTVLAKLEAIQQGAAPAGPSEQKDVIDAQFSAFVEKVYIDSYHRTLFEIWKERQNIRAVQNGGSKYLKDLAGFVIDAMDEFFEQRGIDLQYVEEQRVRRVPAGTMGRYR